MGQGFQDFLVAFADAGGQQPLLEAQRRRGLAHHLQCAETEAQLFHSKIAKIPRFFCTPLNPRNFRF